MNKPGRRELLSTTEVGDVFDVSRHAVWAWIQNGYIEAERRGRRWFVHREEVEALQRWIAAGNFVWERNWNGEPGPSVLDRRYAARRARKALQKLDVLERATRDVAASSTSSTSDVEAALDTCRSAYDALWEYDIDALDDLFDVRSRKRIADTAAAALDEITEVRRELEPEAAGGVEEE